MNASPSRTALLRLSFIPLIFLCAGELAIASPPASLPAAGQDKFSLWSTPARLRGANIYQRRVYPELDGPDFMGPGPLGPPYSQEDLDRLAAFGANYVNISHPGLFTETPPYVLDGAVRDNLDALLARASRANLFAVISFRTGPGRSEFTFLWEGEETWFEESYLNDEVWISLEAQDAWVEMWRYAAERYRGNPAVAGYDLMVEPNANDRISYDPADSIWDPDEFYALYQGTLRDWNQLAPRISEAVREADADTPILVGGMGYSAPNWLPHLAVTGDSRTVYTVHQYDPHQYTHQPSDSLANSYPGLFDIDGDGTDDPFDQAWLDGWLSPLEAFQAAHGVPLAVNEFGLMRWEPGGETFMTDEMEWMEGRGLNHALWVWDPSWGPYAGNDDFNFRHGPDANQHTDVSDSALLGVIRSVWSRNAVRPLSSGTCAGGDYDGNGADDFAVFRPAWGWWAVRGFTGAYFGGAGDRPVAGDYDGDGTAEAGIFRPDSGLWAIPGLTRCFFGSVCDFPVPGDYDGDGSCEIAVHRSIDGLWGVRGLTRAVFGGAGDPAVPGDYDGDGTDEPAVFRPATGLWAARGTTRVHFGTSGDCPVPGDYSGGRRFAPAVFRPGSGLWAVRLTTRTYLGGNRDLPSPADFDGDGTDEPAVFRPAAGFWAVRNCTRIYFGSTGDIPATR